MKHTYTLAGLGLALLVAACGQKAENNEAAPANAAAETAGAMNASVNETSADVGNMAMSESGAAKMAKGTGTVTEVDKAAGTITLDHGPIPEANWPAMTMGFKATPELIDSVKPGDKVAFDLALKDGAGEITAITKQ